MKGRSQMQLDFAERDKRKPVLLRLSWAGNLEKPLNRMSLYGTEWRERGYELCCQCPMSKYCDKSSLTVIISSPFGHTYHPWDVSRG